MSALNTILDTINSLRNQSDALRNQADALEFMLVNSAEEIRTLAEEAIFLVFDPDVDEPPVKPDVGGSREQRAWCELMLWAQLRALTVRRGRGATQEESKNIAIIAGYKDARGWNAWSSGWEKDIEGNRCFTDAGMVNLAKAYAKVKRSLPNDLK